MIQFDVCIFFKRGWFKPPNQPPGFSCCPKQPPFRASYGKNRSKIHGDRGLRAWSKSKHRTHCKSPFNGDEKKPAGMRLVDKNQEAIDDWKLKKQATNGLKWWYIFIYIHDIYIYTDIPWVLVVHCKLKLKRCQHIVNIHCAKGLCSCVWPFQCVCAHSSNFDIANYWITVKFEHFESWLQKCWRKVLKKAWMEVANSGKLHSYRPRQIRRIMIGTESGYDFGATKG